MANNLPGINAKLVTGHYLAYYATRNATAITAPTVTLANDIGQSRDGIVWKRVPHLQPVIVDEAGEVPVNGIQQGVEHFVTLDYVEYGKVKAALEAAVGQSTGAGVNACLTDEVGLELLGKSTIMALVLIPKTGTAAATDLGAGKGLLFPYAAVDTDVDVLLASKLRQGPCSFHCYPDPVSGQCWAIVAVAIPAS